MTCMSDDGIKVQTASRCRWLVCGKCVHTACGCTRLVCGKYLVHLCVMSCVARLDALCHATGCPVSRHSMPCVTPFHALCDATGCSPTPFLGQGCVDTSETIIDITHERDKDRHVDISHERDKDRVASSSC